MVPDAQARGGYRHMDKTCPLNKAASVRETTRCRAGAELR